MSKTGRSVWSPQLRRQTLVLAGCYNPPLEGGSKNPKDFSGRGMPQDRPTRAERRSQFKRGMAKELRRSSTDAERILWSLLRRKQLAHVRFRRQQTIGPYIVDFYCSLAKLVIELDGSQHSEEKAIAYDEARTKWLKENGYRVLRFANVEFLKNKEGTLEAIWNAVKNGGSPLPEIRGANFDPPSRGG